MRGLTVGDVAQLGALALKGDGTVVLLGRGHLEVLDGLALAAGATLTLRRGGGGLLGGRLLGRGVVFAIVSLLGRRGLLSGSRGSSCRE
jgi:hypothetical protein